MLSTLTCVLDDIDERMLGWECICEYLREFTVSRKGRFNTSYCILEVAGLKGDCNENREGSGRWRMLANGLGLRRSRFICFLNMPFLF